MPTCQTGNGRDEHHERRNLRQSTGIQAALLPRLCSATTPNSDTITRGPCALQAGNRDFSTRFEAVRIQVPPSARICTINIAAQTGQAQGRIWPERTRRFVRGLCAAGVLLGGAAYLRSYCAGHFARAILRGLFCAVYLRGLLYKTGPVAGRTCIRLRVCARRGGRCAGWVCCNGDSARHTRGHPSERPRAWDHGDPACNSGSEEGT